jgi:hypothetical protein
MYTSTVSGSNLTTQTYFDIRYRAPGSTVDSIAFNWQTGNSTQQSVGLGTATGTWTITGVYAHQDPADHSGSFVTVAVSLMVQ